MSLNDEIMKNKIISIVRGIPEEKILNVADALLEGGVRFIEVTFDQSSLNGIQNTIDCISILYKERGEKMHVGAGTVLTEEQVQLAYENGVEYIISPNVKENVIRKTKELGLLSMPGAMSPSEIEDAHEYGADIVKVFPAEQLGTAYIQAIKSPLSHIPLAAVGGISVDNIASFAKVGCCCFGAGGCLVNKKIVSEDNYKKITETAIALRKNLGLI